LWLTPEQVKILPVSDKYNEYAKEVAQFLEISDIRALVDERNEKIGRKIRDAEVSKTPFMLIVGEKEVESGQLSVRRHGQGDQGAMSKEEFVQLIADEISQLID
jgi:threonyl-tRNA synthetase